MNFTDEVVKRAKELGADLVGIAPVERFKGAPLRMSPQGLLPEAKSVIVCAIHHPDAAVELGGEPTPHNVGPYGIQSSAINPKLDDVSFLLARFLEDKGYKCLPIAASNIWRYKGYKDMKVDFAPDIAHRYAAVAAGLGEIGWSGLALTPQFGPRQRFVTIITEAGLTPSPMYQGNPLCDKCMACVKNCPTDAYRKEVKKINEITIGDKSFKFPDTNKWRCGWAENFALNLALKIPEKVDEKVILQSLEKYGWRGGEEGCCLKFCMVPEKRYYDSAYCRAPRRKKEKTVVKAERMFKKIKKIMEKNYVDILAIGERKDFKKDISVHPEYHLPDVSSIISIGINIPPGSEGTEDVPGSIHRRLHYTAFDIAHFLDINGHSAVTGTKINDYLIAQRFGVYQKDTYFTTILTSANLPSRKMKREQERGITAQQLRKFCGESGTDLVGFFNLKRFDLFKRTFGGKLSLPEETESVRDTNWIYGSYCPVIEKEALNLKGPADWLPEAKSVVVLGLHFPDASLDTAKVTPAETVGPYAFVQFETLNLLGDIAYKVIKRLNGCGYQATFTYDLTGLASKVISSRGLLPDMRANLFPAVLSGLACIGIHGYPITEKFGVRQRFISIITDMPLPNDLLYSGKIPCETCNKVCIDSCPTKAIKKGTAVMELGDKKFKLPKIDRFACDWAKRYGLSGKEGPEYFGLKSDLPVPKDKSSKEVMSALKKVPWGVQKRHIGICEECIRTCKARGLLESLQDE